jgi:phage baseplate assembly protein W
MASSTASPRSHLGSGWAFPVRPAGGRLRYVGDETDIEQAIGIILETARRERVMRPSFGGTLRERVFDGNSIGLARRVEHEVAAALRDWEPRIQVERITAHPATVQPHVLLIEIDYVVRRTNAFYNLVYPFYLTEGS